MNAQTVRMDAEQAADAVAEAWGEESSRDRAWRRYASISHADINVGWTEYLAELEAIRLREMQA